jgi:putative ABC transport system permease protein
LLLAVWGTPLLVSIIPDKVPRIHEVNVDLRVLGFALLMSVATGVVFGLAPALQASRTNPNESLKESGRGMTGGLRQSRLRAFLIVSEVSLAVVLMTGATLLTKSFVRLLQVNPGFDPSQVLTMEVSLPTLPPSKYADEQEQAAYFKEVLSRLNHSAGVTAAGAVLSLPLTGAEEGTDLFIEGRPRPTFEERPNADYTIVSPEYFRALQIPLLKGRQLSDRDDRDAPAVIMINEALARRYWPNEEPIGQRLTVGFEQAPRQIIGVVGNVKQTTLNADPRPTMYMPHLQRPTGGMTIVIRTNLDPASLSQVARTQIHSVDPSIPVTNIRTMNEVFSTSIAQQRFAMLLVGLFGALALVLATIGIYGVMSYSVTQRTHEIGLRMALGAQRTDVLRLILQHGILVSLAGVIVGVAASFGLTRVMSSLLFGVTPTDLMVFATVAIGTLAMAAIATYLPAWRASRVDPLIALRYE